MAWVDICSKVYDSNYAGAHVKVVIQYNNSNITTTTLTCRAIGYLTDYNGSYGDTYFIYSNGGGISRICYLGDTKTKKDGSLYYTSNNFTLTKTNTATYFTLPELRLCNDGSHSSNYTDSNGRGWAIYWNNQRHMWTTVNSGGSTISTSVYVTNNTAGGAPTITDNGNNTFSISGKSGTEGSYNDITETKLQYKIGSGSWTTDGDNSYSGTVTANTYYTARTRYKCSYGGDSSGYLYSAESNKTIYFYKAPGDVGTPALTAASFKNGRLTVKQNWTYAWTAAKEGSTDSPVQGYRIRMYKNGSLVKGITAGSGSNISKGTGTNEYLDRTGSTNCSITFNPVSFGFEPGDTIYIGVFAWATNGAGSVLWSGGGSTHVTSATTTVQNSGIMRVRPAGSWKEGVVSVKVDGKWIEADVVQIKADGKWKESE